MQVNRLPMTVAFLAIALATGEVNGTTMSVGRAASFKDRVAALAAEVGDPSVTKTLESYLEQFVSSETSDVQVLRVSKFIGISETNG